MEVALNPAINSTAASESESAAGADPPADNSSRAADLRTQMLQRIGELTRPAPPPKGAHFLGTSKFVRQLSGEPDDLVASLIAEFDLAQLVDARILEYGPENVLRLSTILGDSSSSFLFLGKNKLPSDIVSARGLLSSPEPDWIRIAAESAEDETGRPPQPVLAAFSDDEMLLFARLGLNFAPAAGLEEISGRNVRALFTRRAHRAKRKCNITIAAWQIAGCVNEPDPNVLRAIAHISKIQKHFGYDPATVFDAWVPSAVEFHDIRSAWAFADRNLIAATLRASLKHSRYSPADALRLVGDRRETSYGVARRHLHRAIEASKLVPQVGEVNVALTKFRQAFQKAVVSKFLVLADGDCWEEWRSMMAAELAETWFEKLELVKAARKVLAGEYPAYREAFDLDLFDLQLRMSSAFAKLYRLKPPG